MLKRIALFILAHIAFFGVAAAIVVASTSVSDAQTDNPYQLDFEARADADLVAGPDAGAATIGSVAEGTRDIRLRWCRPEFAIEQWMFGSSRRQRQLLDERVCEVQVGGQIGFVRGEALRVQ
ncbi:MAG: hypothetical protein AAGH60_07130 [Pseudomonadota bacterium]